MSKNVRWFTVALLVLVVSSMGTASAEVIAATSETAAATKSMKIEETKETSSLQAKIETDKGVILLELFSDAAPITVANFVNLANRGYYDGLTFHRVIADFMIQGGDPDGTGRGGPGYRFEDEFDSALRFDTPGILAMANAGPGTNGSQFFITHVPTPHLNNRHTIFGKVVEGQEVVDSIQMGDHMVTIKIIGDYEPLLSQHQDRIEQWNAQLN